MGIPPATNSQFSLDRVSGIPVHLFCWCHVERFIGPSAEKNLGSLVYALRSRSPYSHCEQAILNFRPSFDPGTFILSVVLIEELGLTWSGGEDPFDSKAVRRLIKRSAWVNTNHKRRKAKYREAFLPFCSCYVFPSTSSTSFLICLIMKTSRKCERGFASLYLIDTGNAGRRKTLFTNSAISPTIILAWNGNTLFCSWSV